MIIEGIAAWAHVQKPSPDTPVKTRDGRTFTPESKYKLDLIIDGAKAKELKAKGYNVKTVRSTIPGIDGSEGQPYLIISKKVKWPDGTPQPKPSIFNTEGKEIEDLVGNGSEVQVQYDEVKYMDRFANEERTATRLKAIMVTKLVPFEDKAVEFKFKAKPKDTKQEEFDFNKTDTQGWE